MPKRNRNTKAKIVSAAWSLFYSQGYDGTTVDDIVEASETSKGSFYHYFESKDALLSSLSYLFDEKYEQLQNSLGGMSSMEKLLYLNQELFGLIDDKIDQNLIAMLYSTQLLKRGEKSLIDNDRFYYKLLRRIVSEGQQSGELNLQISVNDIVRLYAMCERAMICEWCMCNCAFSLKDFSKQNLPRLLKCIEGIDAEFCGKK